MDFLRKLEPKVLMQNRNFKNIGNVTSNKGVVRARDTCPLFQGVL